MEEVTVSQPPKPRDVVPLSFTQIPPSSARCPHQSSVSPRYSVPQLRGDRSLFSSATLRERTWKMRRGGHHHHWLPCHLDGKLSLFPCCTLIEEYYYYSYNIHNSRRQGSANPPRVVVYGDLLSLIHTLWPRAGIESKTAPVQVVVGMLYLLLGVVQCCARNGRTACALHVIESVAGHTGLLQKHQQQQPQQMHFNVNPPGKRLYSTQEQMVRKTV